MPTKKKMYTATFTYEGQRYYVRSTVSQREAEKKAVKKLAALEAEENQVNGDMPVDHYFTQWVETYKRDSISAIAYRDYRTRHRLYVSPQIGTMKVKDVRPIHIQQIVNSLKGHSLSSCVKVSAQLKAMFAQAVEDDMIRKNPARKATMPQATDGTNRSITPEERQALLQVAQTDPFGLFVKIMLWCGLRPQEVAALEWTDIDAINRRIMVRRALKRDGVIGPPKSAAGNRDVPIPPQLWECLRFGSGYVVTNAADQPYLHSTIHKNWRRFKSKMNLALGAKTDEQGLPLENLVAPDLTLYCLRHTYGTDLEAAGVPINVAKYLMGHSSITMTSRVYTHMREDTLETAAQTIASFVPPTAQKGATAGATTAVKTAAKDLKTSDETLYQENKA